MTKLEFVEKMNELLTSLRDERRRLAEKADLAMQKLAEKEQQIIDVEETLKIWGRMEGIHGD